MLIYWANAAYGIRIFGYELFHFFPMVIDLPFASTVSVEIINSSVESESDPMAKTYMEADKA